MDGAAAPAPHKDESAFVATSPPAVPQRTPSQTSLHKSTHAHRQSFAENLRNAPGSPRAQRHPSFTQAAVQELLNHPPAANKHSNPRFAGRDWRDVSVNELVAQDDVKWVDLDSSIEEASMVCRPKPSFSVVTGSNSALDSRQAKPLQCCPNPRTCIFQNRGFHFRLQRSQHIPADSCRTGKAR